MTAPSNRVTVLNGEATVSEAGSPSKDDYRTHFSSAINQSALKRQQEDVLRF